MSEWDWVREREWEWMRLSERKIYSEWEIVSRRERTREKELKKMERFKF